MRVTNRVTAMMMTMMIMMTMMTMMMTMMMTIMMMMMMMMMICNNLNKRIFSFSSSFYTYDALSFSWLKYASAIEQMSVMREIISSDDDDDALWPKNTTYQA